jgi:hypothetical protein
VLERWTFDIQTDRAVVEGRWGAGAALLGGSASTVPRAEAEALQQPIQLRWRRSEPLLPGIHCCSLCARAPSPVALPCSGPLPEKSEAQVTSEIQAIIRQITASVTFLPLLQDKCEAPPQRAARHAARAACTWALARPAPAAPWCAMLSSVPSLHQASIPSGVLSWFCDCRLTRFAAAAPLRRHDRRAGLHGQGEHGAPGLGGKRPALHRQRSRREAARLQHEGGGGGWGWEGRPPCWAEPCG